MKKVLLCLGLLISLSVGAGNLPLVKNGKSNAAIVIADDAVFSARYAADELASYIEKGKYEIVEDRKEAVLKALNSAKSGDIVVLLAKGEETYQKVRGVFTPYESDLKLTEDWVEGKI